jgi:periplasmic protein TonB
MTALATNGVAPRRQEVFRWAVCALVVLLAHGFAVFALSTRDDAYDLDAESPVALIELAPIPVAPSSTETDLPPGPMAPDAEQRDRVEASAQKPPEKPPVPQAAQHPAASDPLPPPDPPKEQLEQAAPQDPIEASTAAAPPAATEVSAKPAAPAAGHVSRLLSASTLRWERSLVAHLERSKRYPREAAGRSGVARLAFSIDREGRLLDSWIVKSSGSAILDAQTLALVRRAEPFPPPPGDVADDQLSFVVPIRYASSFRR